MADLQMLMLNEGMTLVERSAAWLLEQVEWLRAREDEEGRRAVLHNLREAADRFQDLVHRLEAAAARMTASDEVYPSTRLPVSRATPTRPDPSSSSFLTTHRSSSRPPGRILN
jgi:hypothetical protein